MANVWRKFPSGNDDGESDEKDMDMMDYVSNAERISIDALLDAMEAAKQNEQEPFCGDWCGAACCDGPNDVCCEPNVYSGSSPIESE